MVKRLCLAFILLIAATAVANCVCLSFVGMNSLNYPRHWYNASFVQSPDENVTVLVSAMALGDTPIRIMDSDSDRITLSVLYYTKPEFRDYRPGGNRTIAVYAHYDNDWTQGVGADIYLYLPGNGHYDVRIRNPSADKDNSVYAAGSPLLINYTRGNLTYWLNDRDHPLPFQASDL